MPHGWEVALFCANSLVGKATGLQASTTGVLPVLVSIKENANKIKYQGAIPIK